MWVGITLSAVRSTITTDAASCKNADCYEVTFGVEKYRSTITVFGLH
jgi:hypothetical protein